jgi:hypothetical protein
MDYEVLKPFKSVNRRFAPGAGPGGSVSDTDDVAPHSIESLCTKNFIEAKNEMVSAPPAPPPNEMSTAKMPLPDPISK